MIPLPAGPARTPVASVAIRLMISGSWLTGGVAPSGKSTPACSRPAEVQVLPGRLVGGQVLKGRRSGAVGEDGGPQASACWIDCATNSARVSVVADALMSNWNGMYGMMVKAGTAPNSW